MGFGIKTRVKGLAEKLGYAYSGVVHGVDKRRQRTFQKIYENHAWGFEEGGRFHSGGGSRGQAVDDHAGHMTRLLRQDAEELGRPLTIVDLGCGDFNIGARLVAAMPDATYIGCDIVPELVSHNQKRFGGERISFRVVDMVRDPLPDGDVCLVREVFQHLPNGDIASVLPKLTHRFVYVTEAQPLHPEGRPNPGKPVSQHMRFDWRTGRGRGVELGLEPFGVAVEEVFRTQSNHAQHLVTQRVRVS